MTTVKEMDVNDAELVQSVDLSQLNDDELAKELERRKKAKKAAKDKAEKEFQRDKEQFLQFAQGKFEQLNKELITLKQHTLKEANNLYNRMYEMKDKEPKQVKSFQLTNKKNNVKLVVERQERFEFSEEAHVHIQSIREIFKSKFEARHKGMYNILDGLLIKNSKMEYDPKLLAKARRQVRELGDQELINEFDQLDECQKVTSSQMYCRLYVKYKDQGWEDVTLQFSSL